MVKVSIILPVYNSENYLKDTIKSIIKQTYTNWELIIVDDNSQDNSMKIIEKFKNEKITIIKNEKNIGAALSRNKAIEKALGQYIAFIDSDDIWEREKLENQLKFMQENKIGFSFSSYQRIAENGEVVGKVFAPCEVTYKDILESTPIQISTVMFDTQIVKKELIKMPELKTCEDISMYLKVLNAGFVAKGLQQYLVKYKVRKNSLSSNKFINTVRRWKVYKEYNIGFRSRIVYIFRHIKNAVRRTNSIKKYSRFKEVICLLSLRQIVEIILFPFIWIISKFSKSFCPNDIWIIEENPNEACDNGYIFFKFLRENRKDINVYYVINRKSKDYKKVESLGNIIKHGSLKHWIYYLNAKKIIATQKYANPSFALFYLLHTKNILKTPRIFLQHGITKDDAKMFYYGKTKFRLFICGAKKEYNYVKTRFQYPKENVIYTGFARFDNLNLDNKNKLILVAPTWRKWIKNQKEFDAFIQKYYDLINNNELIKYLEKYGIELQMVLHKNMKKFKINKNTSSKLVSIYHNDEVDIQKVINKTGLLITDYSSIFMDIAYRKKPIIYYQFDNQEFREYHLQEGYFSYKNDGFGDVIREKEKLVNKIKFYIENNFEIEKKYSKRMDDFFERKDKNNCKRILEEIEKI